MKVLVTGAARRGGANVVKRLVDEGLQVRATLQPGDPQGKKLDALPATRVVEANLGDQLVIDACENVTHIIHLAAQFVPTHDFRGMLLDAKAGAEVAEFIPAKI